VFLFFAYSRSLGCCTVTAFPSYGENLLYVFALAEGSLDAQIEGVSATAPISLEVCLAGAFISGDVYCAEYHVYDTNTLR
jgi:hypothetical protein